MAAQQSLAPAGSSSYSSNTLHVGDGTWDATTDTFLLPNVVGLNFATMRYNGMGNRFRTVQQYHTIILAHGILAGLTFLILVPTAILVASFYHRNPRLALRIHIAINTFVVILVTIIFILGYFAVGPERSLTNPHHGIGLAIFLLILVQAFGGWVIKKIEKGKVRYHIPIKLMLHQWVGRAIALLALAQIPIGLTLYGSPASLFVLYTLVVAAYLVLYFVLTYKNHVRAAAGYDEGSYGTGSGTDVTGNQHNRHRLEKIAGVIGLGAAAAAIRRRSSGRQHREEQDSEYNGPQGTQTGSYVSEKQSDNGRENHTWRNRILGGVAGAGALAVLKSRLGSGKSKDRRNESNNDYPRPPLGGAVNQAPMNESVQNVAALEEGVPMRPNNDWQRVEQREAAQQAGMRSDLQSGDSYTDYDPKERRRFGPFAIPAGIAAFGGVGEWWRRRRGKNEEGRLASERMNDQENERLFNNPSGRPLYTGDGTPRRHARQGSQFSNGSPQGDVRNSGQYYNNPNTFTPNLNTQDWAPRQQAPIQNIPPPPRQTMAMPPPPPVHQSPVNSNSAASDPYASPSRARPSRYNNQPQVLANEPLLRSTPAATAATDDLLSPPPPIGGILGDPNRRSSPHANVESPPVSVKVKMHTDGRHVTLRRLNEEEAARERESRRTPQQAVPPQLGTPVSGAGSPAQQLRRPGQTSSPYGQAGPSNLSLPAHGSVGVPSNDPSGIGGAISPGDTAEYAGTETSDFASNRRRRRAERARAQQARQEAQARKGGRNVEFE